MSRYGISLIEKPRWVPISCVTCRARFFVIPAYAKREKPVRFCGAKCFGAWRSTEMKGSKNYQWSEIIRQCQHCRKPYRITPKREKNSRFCSRKCLAGHKAKTQSGENSPYWNQIELTCVECGGVYFCKPSHAKISKTCSKSCHSKRMEKVFAAEGNHQWRGGLSRMPYPIVFNAALKRRIRERDHHKCVACGKTEQENGENLTTHHIDYDKQNCSDGNLAAVCRPCNARVNKNREQWIKFFRGKVA